MDSSLTIRIDQLVLDAYSKSADIILQGRRALVTVLPSSSSTTTDYQLNPTSPDDRIGRYNSGDATSPAFSSSSSSFASSSSSSTSATYAANTEHCNKVLSAWKRHLTAPLVIDVYITSSDNRQLVLIERWKLLYQRSGDSRDGRLILINRRINILLRTLYCFVRLLPGFQLLNVTSNVFQLKFHIYNSNISNGGSFTLDSSTYEFPRLNTQRGVMCMGVRYVRATALQVKFHAFIFL